MAEDALAMASISECTRTMPFRKGQFSLLCKNVCQRRDHPSNVAELLVALQNLNRTSEMNTKLYLVVPHAYAWFLEGSQNLDMLFWLHSKMVYFFCDQSSNVQLRLFRV